MPENTAKGNIHMKYPYITFADNTEVTFSPVHEDGTVQVYVETPVQGGFKSITCQIPGYTYNNNGYSVDEQNRWLQFVRNNSHIIIELARCGGFSNATAI